MARGLGKGRLIPKLSKLQGSIVLSTFVPIPTIGFVTTKSHEICPFDDFLPSLHDLLPSLLMNVRTCNVQRPQPTRVHTSGWRSTSAVVRFLLPALTTYLSGGSVRYPQAPWPNWRRSGWKSKTLDGFGTSCFLILPTAEKAETRSRRGAPPEKSRPQVPEIAEEGMFCCSTTDSFAECWNFRSRKRRNSNDSGVSVQHPQLE